MGNPVDSIRVTVTTAGTAVRVSAASRKVSALAVKSISTNTGLMYLGGTDVDNTFAPISAGDSFSLQAPQTMGNTIEFDLADLWVDASVSGEFLDLYFLEL